MRVLIAEDDRLIADTVAEGLRDDGIAVDISYDGLDAAAKLDLNPYDVIVLDRDLPRLHGDHLCRMIVGSDQPTMILMLTAADSPTERVTGLALGADDYLPKPFHFPELLLRVRALARRKPTPSRTLKSEGIELDTIARTASRDGHPLNLSAKEYGILEALLQSSPTPLSAETLLARVWDENADPFTQTVKMTISRLRHKLGEPQVIHTAPGIGYRIETPPARLARGCDEHAPVGTCKSCAPKPASSDAVAVAGVDRVGRQSPGHTGG